MFENSSPRPLQRVQCVLMHPLPPLRFRCCLPVAEFATTNLRPDMSKRKSSEDYDENNSLQELNHPRRPPKHLIGLGPHRFTRFHVCSQYASLVDLSWWYRTAVRNDDFKVQSFNTPATGYRGPCQRSRENLRGVVEAWEGTGTRGYRVLYSGHAVIFRCISIYFFQSISQLLCGTGWYKYRVNACHLGSTPDVNNLQKRLPTQGNGAACCLLLRSFEAGGRGGGG